MFIARRISLVAIEQIVATSKFKLPPRTKKRRHDEKGCWSVVGASDLRGYRVFRTCADRSGLLARIARSSSGNGHGVNLHQLSGSKKTVLVEEKIPDRSRSAESAMVAGG